MESRVREIGLQLWSSVKTESKGLFDKNHWQGKLMDWVMKDPEFKIDLFHFVDLLPSLETPQEVSEHIRQYLLRDGRELHGLMDFALKAATTELTAGLASKAIRKNVSDLAQRFIAGETPESALGKLKKMHKQGCAFTIDLLGETTLSNHEGKVFQKRYLELIDRVAKETPGWPAQHAIDQGHLGSIPRGNVSVKISSLVPFLDCVDQRGCVARLKELIRPLFIRAKTLNVFLNVDLENWDMHEISYTLFEELLLEPELRTYPHFGMVVQTYLKQSHAHCERLLKLAKERGSSISIRLVKGAYWDYEQVLAGLYGWECPLYLEKAQSDAQYEELTCLLLDHPELIQVGFASHNLRSIAHAIAAAEERGLPKTSYEFQMLTGMAEPLRKSLLKNGHRVRVYSPIGALLPGMSYLVRRLLENTSNTGFMKMGFEDKANPKLLLQKPAPTNSPPSKEPPVGFTNCPLTDFRNPLKRKQMLDALEVIQSQFPLNITPSIYTTDTEKANSIALHSPSDSSICVSQTCETNEDQLRAAIEASSDAWPNWRTTALEERVRCLNQLADLLEEDRFHLAALMVFESAKPIREADADVAEAVDFCRYYAQAALVELAPVTHDDLAGETNTLFYEGRGPSAIIAPWNFPLAIMCGMATAALVAGNTLLLKPAEQSPAIASLLFEKMKLAGFPKDVVQFLPGKGETIGKYLVEDPAIANIAFTGSMKVGLQIQKEASKIRPGQKQIKRVVCEMGGKNAIIVDKDAELDDAIKGIMHSAFDYTGQKCSACSRVVFVNPDKQVFNNFKNRLIQSMASLQLAPAHLPECMMGPVIDNDSRNRINQIIDNPSPRAELLFKGEIPPSLPQGYYVPPTLFEVESGSHNLMQEEFFGPILALMRCDTYDEALEIANATPYALTGAVYSRLPSHIERAKTEFRVGNLYINRASTGALVGRQPFGGFNMSGGGSKAGGPGYLMHFVDPRIVTENTIRRGFTPELQV